MLQRRSAITRRNRIVCRPPIAGVQSSSSTGPTRSPPDSSSPDVHSREMIPEVRNDKNAVAERNFLLQCNRSQLAHHCIRGTATFGTSGHWQDNSERGARDFYLDTVLGVLVAGKVTSQPVPRSNRPASAQTACTRAGGTGSQNSASRMAAGQVRVQIGIGARRT